LQNLLLDIWGSICQWSIFNWTIWVFYQCKQSYSVCSNSTRSMCCWTITWGTIWKCSTRYPAFTTKRYCFWYSVWMRCGQGGAEFLRFKTLILKSNIWKNDLEMQVLWISQKESLNIEMICWL
jgi:hypothetical protein